MDTIGHFLADFGRISYMTEAPHVHIHYMQDDKLMEDDGYADLEVCCHGCHCATIYRYSAKALLEFEEAVRMGKGDPDKGHPRIREIRDQFFERHKECVPKEKSLLFMHLCPGNRTMIQFYDLREEGL